MAKNAEAHTDGEEHRRGDEGRQRQGQDSGWIEEEDVHDHRAGNRADEPWPKPAVPGADEVGAVEEHERYHIERWPEDGVQRRGSSERGGDDGPGSDARAGLAHGAPSWMRSVACQWLLVATVNARRAIERTSGLGF